MITKLKQKITSEQIRIQTPKTVIKGDLYLPRKSQGVVIFAHGAGSSRLSPRNQHVAEILYEAGFASLLMDLLSEEEDQESCASIFHCWPDVLTTLQNGF